MKMLRTFHLDITRELVILSDIYQASPAIVLQDFMNKAMVEQLTSPSYCPVLNFLSIIHGGEFSTRQDLSAAKKLVAP